MVDTGEAQSIDVTGEFINVFGIGWVIVITRPEKTSRFDINWLKGVIAVSARAA